MPLYVLRRMQSHMSTSQPHGRRIYYPMRLMSGKTDSFGSLIQVRFGVALVGPAGSGKTTIRRLLAEGSTWLRQEELKQARNSSY